MRTATEAIEKHSRRFEWGSNDCIQTALSIHRHITGQEPPERVLVDVDFIYDMYPTYKDVMAKGNFWIESTWNRLLCEAGWMHHTPVLPGAIMITDCWRFSKRYGPLVAFMADDHHWYAHSLDKDAMTRVNLEIVHLWTHWQLPEESS